MTTSIPISPISLLISSTPFPLPSKRYLIIQYSKMSSTSSPMQTVFRLPKKGGNYTSLKCVKEPIPEILPHQVLLQIHATSLNYRDLAIANGSYPNHVKEDIVPFSDASGTVIKTGTVVEKFKQGDKCIINFDIANLYGAQKTWTHGLGAGIDGVLREYIAVSESALIRIPSAGSDNNNPSWEELACLVCTGTTAWNALFGHNPSTPLAGSTVLFLGTGGVSITGLILAKAAGATTIITSSSEDKLQQVKQNYGVDHTINYKTHPNWGEKVQEITQGDGADIVFENGGSGTIAQSIAAVARGGVVAVIGFLSRSEQRSMPDVAALVMSKACTVRGVNVGTRELTEELVRFVSAKKLKMPVEKVYGFNESEVQKAYQEIEAGGHIGKICIRIRA